MLNSELSDKHIAFARAVVALAREHGMDNLRMTYRIGVTAAFAADERWNSTDVTMNWAQGRHGDESRLSVQYTAAVSLSERASATEGASK